MRNLFYSLSLLPLLSYAGGDIQPIEINYDEVVVVEEKKVVEDVPSKEIAEKKVTAEAPSLVSAYYVGASVAKANVDGQNNNVIVKNAHPLAVVGKLGYNFSENIAAEGRAGIGVKKDAVNALATSEIKQILGVYLKPNIDVIDNVNLFGLLGYTNVKQGINNDTLTTNGLSYGAGIGYQLTDSWEIVADAVYYGKKDTESIDAYSFGLNYNF